MQQKTRLIALAIAVAAAALSAWLLLEHLSKKTPGGAGAAGIPQAAGKTGDKNGSSKTGGAKITEHPSAGRVNKDDGGDDSSQSEMAIYRAVVRELDDALDDGLPERILVEAAKLRQHHEPAVRERVAFALSWLGVKGLPELTAMLGDPDPEVAQEIFDRWSQALDEVEDDASKAALLGAAIQTFGEDMSEDVFTDLLFDVAMLDSEYALPQLVAMLQHVTRPDQRQEVIDEIHGQMEHDNPSDNSVELSKQALAEVDKLRQERLEEERQARLDGTDDSDSAEVQGLPFNRRAAGEQESQQAIDPAVTP